MPGRRRSALSVVAWCGVVALVAACGAAPVEPPRPDPTSDPTPRLEQFYGQRLSWGPCGEYADGSADRVAFGSRSYDCARLRVPLDYAQPDGETAQIGVLRHHATGPDRIGSLVMNPGGPGASGMELVPALSGRLADSPLGRRFDLVGFDPRGVGASTPTINCLDDGDWPAERADLDVDPSSAGTAQSEAENRDFAVRCAQRSGGATVLAHLGTREVVKDLDVLRAALGEQKLTYLGYSYGTRVGSSYAEAFPERVRALVLDGALSPGESSFDQNVAQAVGFQRAFDAFATDCARRPNCPLGRDPAAATAAFQAIVRPLIDSPARAAEGRALSFSDAITGVNQALYVSSYWPVLARGISALAGGDGTILLTLADMYFQRSPSGRYGGLIEAFISISCLDDQRITDRAQQAELSRRMNEAAPFRDSGRGPVAALDACAFWPVPPTWDRHLPRAHGLPPTLVISTTGDPATPYAAGADLATALGAELVTYEGNQHTIALQGNPCIDDLVTRYLVDLQLPAGEPRCAL